ncbi:MAG: RNA polymerase subunit sigma [Deltaproteobacteria bacterium]|nr:RNA polymerase subunit sigma [Deltaproteobacteria bacterium]
MSNTLRDALAALPEPRTVFVSGAGLSAASGIPTFRGPDGYWTVGSTHYRPEELATNAAFQRMPREVWRWYLFRKAVCNRAEPNGGHQLLADLEAELGDRFTLVSQNVDGLHLRAGNSLGRTYQIHGNIDFMRCLDPECEPLFEPIPESVPQLSKEDLLDDEGFAQLRCSSCGSPTRPHVLWFDECYDEALFRFESSLAAAREADLVVTIGTSGATNLPHQVVATAVRRGALFIDINPESNPFSMLADDYPRGTWLQGTAEDMLPEVAALLSSS